MENNEKEAVEEPRFNSAKEDVRYLLEAYKLAKNAERYEVKQEILSRDTNIFINNGSEMTQNYTLSHYIEMAERKYIELNSPLILEDARFMLEKEIDAIRRLVNG